MRPLSIRLCCMLLCLFAFSAQAAVNTFWSQPQRGGNSFNEQPPDRAYFDALRATGATWVRLTPDKWRSAGGRDFLMGNADRYQGLVPADVATLRRVLDDADAAGIKVVLVPLSLPLLRWKQKNGGVVDQRLWQSFDNHRPAQAFWRDLARALHGHPALVAYNLINEPAPEYGTPLREHADPAAMRAWYATVKDGPRDLPRFYTGLIAAVREVDADMPLMLDPGWYAAADALAYWPAPLKDPHLLYSVHMYEPYAATSAPNQKRAAPYRYPAVVPFGPGKTQWDAKRVASYLQQPLAWADEHGVARNQMVVGEFGCMRRWPDCPAYLEDVLRVLEAQKVHWAFYAFREDAWDGMDYELGDAALPWTYWRDVEAGKVPTPMRADSPQFAPILKRLRAADR
ncbi:cellulase family glycosylhydrolase [Stenotrophomonas rhizophila]|uniref:glycoside hydrolase family 5 protein n=1 Tax=Stenotrophomonas rhizophila TaxID=216778 RepID=UPI002A6A954E|nr:cellulase family glycosylhydrolase [Stenotrophomonas rhizophila]MDY0955204.1 cellulase family glycosylhydrolase [Stenotrophomonas rhizophila]